VRNSPSEMPMIFDERSSGTQTALSYDEAKAILDDLPLADAIEKMCDLWENGQIDAVLTRLVRYISDRRDVERLLSFLPEEALQF